LTVASSASNVVKESAICTVRMMQRKRLCSSNVWSEPSIRFSIEVSTTP
jgi:hypothetical protein